MKKSLVEAICVLACGFAISAFGQGFTLIMGENPNPGVDHNGANLTAGSLVQLIRTTITGSGGNPPAPNILDPSGLNAGEFLGGATNVTGAGNIAYTRPSALGGLTEASVIFARIFELPSAGGLGSGLLPVPMFDAGQGAIGFWYADQEVRMIVPDLGNSGSPIYAYQFNTTSSPQDWQFQVTGAIPEPASLALAGIGLVALLFGRRIRRK